MDKGVLIQYFLIGNRNTFLNKSVKKLHGFYYQNLYLKFDVLLSFYETSIHLGVIS